MRYPELQTYEKILAGAAWRAGMYAQVMDMQRVVPSDCIGKYEEFWKAGYDGKSLEDVT
jgi:hypothetical protein